jgi:inosine/xanthosine triphosphatase
MRVLVGSRNPVKIAAVCDVFTRYFGDVEVIGVEVDPAVPAQPVGDQTFAGAENRARALADLNNQQRFGAAYCVGIEGGIVRSFERWFALGVICIVDDQGRMGFGASPQFGLPDDITNELLAGVELGDVVDRLTGEENTKQRAGAIGYLTRGQLDRQNLYAQGIVVALVPFVNTGLYFGEDRCVSS